MGAENNTHSVREEKSFSQVEGYRTGWPNDVIHPTDFLYEKTNTYTGLYIQYKMKLTELLGLNVIYSILKSIIGSLEVECWVF